MSSNSKMSKPLKLGQSSPLDKHARRDILHSFRCPRDCRDFEDAYASIIGCPFGHYDLARKKVLPSFVCVPYLLDECPKKMTSDQLLFCEDGFHLADRDLLDLEQFTKRMADYVLQRGPLESKPEFELTGTTSLECCICFAPFNGIYGQLSDCTHVFCAKCITDWFKKERNCPVCRKSSRFILAWHGLIASKEEKAKIAQMQGEMVKVSDVNDSAQAPSVTSSTSQLDYGLDWNQFAEPFDFPFANPRLQSAFERNSRIIHNILRENAQSRVNENGENPNQNGGGSERINTDHHYLSNGALRGGGNSRGNSSRGRPTNQLPSRNNDNNFRSEKW